MPSSLYVHKMCPLQLIYSSSFLRLLFYFVPCLFHVICLSLSNSATYSILQHNSLRDMKEERKNHSNHTHAHLYVYVIKTSNIYFLGQLSAIMRVTEPINIDFLCKYCDVTTAYDEPRSRRDSKIKNRNATRAIDDRSFSRTQNLVMVQSHSFHA